MMNIEIQRCKTLVLTFCFVIYSIGGIGKVPIIKTLFFLPKKRSKFSKSGKIIRCFINPTELIRRRIYKIRQGRKLNKKYGTDL